MARGRDQSNDAGYCYAQALAQTFVSIEKLILRSQLHLRQSQDALRRANRVLARAGQLQHATRNRTDKRPATPLN